MSKTEMEAFAYKCFATAHPHEAALWDWVRFVTFAREQGITLSESEIRQCLSDTEQEMPHD